jgi:hypothetical protein
MRAPDDYGGFFTPEDLAAMQKVFDKDTSPLETAGDRENRALRMFITCAGPGKTDHVGSSAGSGSEL